MLGHATMEGRERGQSTHSNKIGLHGETEWVDLVGNCEGAVR